MVDSIPIPKIAGSVMANQDRNHEKKGGGMVPSSSQVTNANGGHHHSWRSTLFPQVESKSQRLRKSRGDNGSEKIVGFETNISGDLNTDKEILLNLKVKLQNGPDGKWRVTWAGLEGDKSGDPAQILGPKHAKFGNLAGHAPNPLYQTSRNQCPAQCFTRSNPRALLG